MLIETKITFAISEKVCYVHISGVRHIDCEMKLLISALNICYDSKLASFFVIFQSENIKIN